MGYTVNITGYYAVEVRTPSSTEIKNLWSYGKDLVHLGYYGSHSGSIIGTHLSRGVVYEECVESYHDTYEMHGSWSGETWANFLSTIDELAGRRGILFTLVMRPNMTCYYNWKDSKRFYSEFKELYDTLQSDKTFLKDREDNKDTLDKILSIMKCFRTGSLTSESGTFLSWK